VPGGDGFIQLGEWRFGQFDNDFFTFSHQSGNQAITWDLNGAQIPGPRRDRNLWD